MSRNTEIRNPDVKVDPKTGDVRPIGPDGSLPELKLLGYDFGFLEGEYNVYSFLLHEIIYPRFEELGAFAPRLNQNLLLDSVEAIKEIAGV
jgi:hypothetical protein